MAQGRNEIRDLLERHGVRPTKALGQHFLADPNLVDRIVRLAGVGSGDQVVEVGAGTGTLTAALVATGADVVAFEIDERLRPVLEESLGAAPVRLRFEDAGDTLGETVATGRWTMVANLPYHVGTPLLLDTLRHRPTIGRWIVMVQREVADRLAAPPGSRTYGIPSVIVALHARIGERFRVARDVFVPMPQVDSMVIELIRQPPPPAAERAIELAAAAFAGRRKMLRRSLGEIIEQPETALVAAGIDPTSRPEQLSPDAFVRLAAVAP